MAPRLSSIYHPCQYPISLSLACISKEQPDGPMYVYLYIGLSLSQKETFKLAAESCGREGEIRRRRQSGSPPRSTSRRLFFWGVMKRNVSFSHHRSYRLSQLQLIDSSGCLKGRKGHILISASSPLISVL